MVNKKKLARLSWGAHIMIAIILCDHVQNILERIIILASTAIISAIQTFCINNAGSAETGGKTGDSDAGNDSMGDDPTSRIDPNA